MKTYDRVLHILRNVPQTRNSDKLLIWKFWESEIGHELDHLSYGWFMERTTSTESIRRARQKVQELNPELGETSESVRRARKKKEETKGTFVFREYDGQGELL